MAEQNSFEQKMAYWKMQTWHFMYKNLSVLTAVGLALCCLLGYSIYQYKKLCAANESNLEYLQAYVYNRDARELDKILTGPDFASTSPYHRLARMLKSLEDRDEWRAIKMQYPNLTVLDLVHILNEDEGSLKEELAKNNINLNVLEAELAYMRTGVVHKAQGRNIRMTLALVGSEEKLSERDLG